jgi:hypothetical protein
MIFFVSSGTFSWSVFFKIMGLAIITPFIFVLGIGIVGFAIFGICTGLEKLAQRL